ncbi:MAG: hypothetical protein D6722_29520 [Bacteroidetes bacterium]|nr:MAG: hypothetical protein D6722_29520 [Bacteroidota bacterium]
MVGGEVPDSRDFTSFNRGQRREEIPQAGLHYVQEGERRDKTGGGWVQQRSAKRCLLPGFLAER